MQKFGKTHKLITYLLPLLWQKTPVKLFYRVYTMDYTK